MTDTIISSATKEVAIGFGRPFVMIGERINPTGRKLLAEEMKNGDFSRVVSDAIAQVEAGAQMLDVNAGIPLADEPALLVRAIQEVQAVTDVPIAIDSSIVEALEAAIEIYEGKPLINSVTGEEEVLERVLPFVAKHGAAVVAISNDETGISEDPNVRFEVAKKIVNRAADYGIPAADVVVDPLVMPIGAMGTAGRQVFELVGRLRDELKVNTTVTFPSPGRLVIASVTPGQLPAAAARRRPPRAPSPASPGSRLAAIQAAQFSSCPLRTSAAMMAVFTSPWSGFMMAEVMPAPIDIARKVPVML